MKQPWHVIALQVGGSHYPDVGGQLLVRFGETVVEQIVAMCHDPELQQHILDRFGMTKTA
jgi:hypothetical protein